MSPRFFAAARWPRKVARRPRELESPPYRTRTSTAHEGCVTFDVRPLLLLLPALLSCSPIPVRESLLDAALAEAVAEPDHPRDGLDETGPELVVVDTNEVRAGASEGELHSGAVRSEPIADDSLETSPPGCMREVAFDIRSARVARQDDVLVVFDSISGRGTVTLDPSGEVIAYDESVTKMAVGPEIAEVRVEPVDLPLLGCDGTLAIMGRAHRVSLLGAGLHQAVASSARPSTGDPIRHFDHHAYSPSLRVLGSYLFVFDTVQRKHCDGTERTDETMVIWDTARATSVDIIELVPDLDAVRVAHERQLGDSLRVIGLTPWMVAGERIGAELLFRRTSGKATEVPWYNPEVAVAHPRWAYSSLPPAAQVFLEKHGGFNLLGFSVVGARPAH